MKIYTGEYTIEIAKLPEPIDEHTYKSHLVENGYYDFLTIIISEPAGEHISKAIINSQGCIITPLLGSYLHAEDSLVLCIGGDVCCLHIPNLDLLWRTTCDFACCFTIHHFNDDYVIHGEMTITCLSKEGEIRWEFSGRDIFVLHEEQDYDFKIEDNIIMVKDWDRYEYHLDKDGNCIKEKRY